MPVYVVPTMVGVFAVNEKKKVLMLSAFEKDPKKAAEKFKLSQIEMIDEEKEIKFKLGKKGHREFVFGYMKPGEKNIEPNNPGEQFVKDNLATIAVEKGFAKDKKEVVDFITKATVQLAKVHIKRAVTRDGLIIQTNGALEDLDKSINVYMERLREWYGLHFPEMNRAVTGHERFAQVISKFGDRESITEKDLSDLKQNSMGADFKEEDIKMVQMYATKILEMYKLREEIASYSEKVLKEVAPNLLVLAGAPLAIKLIARSGGLKKMSRMPSSTLQLIGAEKALFRYLHGKGKSPRHGVIFSHPMIQNARDQHRGKLARLLASKLTIAAKMDYYSKTYKGDTLKKDLEKKAKNIVSGK